MGEEIYDRIGVGYADLRRPDRRIAAAIEDALGGAASILNVGAGAGSYEPRDRRVVAVEPSLEMIRQRARDAAPAVRATASSLPFADRSFAASLAILTLHHWPDWRRGLAEMRRVSRERVVLLTWDPEDPGFWLTRDYVPEIVAIDRRIFPTMAEMAEALGPFEVRSLPIPADCSDGFLCAYWRRPERYLDPLARRAISTFAKIGDVGPGLARLAADLESGAWEERYGALLDRESLDSGYRLVVTSGAGAPD